MGSKPETNKKILADLESEKESDIISAIKQLYTSGTVEILPHVFKLFFTTNSTIVRSEISELLNNLKDQEASGYFMEALGKYKGQDNYSTIVSSCWQNGLNFSENIQFFINLVIEQDLLTSVEAFSVVEGNISELSAPAREIYANDIRKKIKVVDDEKKSLVKELLHVVENISGPFKINLN